MKENKIVKFWNAFWNAMKTAYSEVNQPVDVSEIQSYEDIKHINFPAIFVGRLSSLGLNESSFAIETTNASAENLQPLVEKLNEDKYLVYEKMMSKGDCFAFPSVDNSGALYHSILDQNLVRIVKSKHYDVYEAYAIVDSVEVKNKVIMLLRHHTLQPNGTLTIDYVVVDDDYKEAYHEKFENYIGYSVDYVNANHIGFGRYKSPISSRGHDSVYGVPINFGCEEIEKEIKETLKQIKTEYANGESRIFTDVRNLEIDENGKPKLLGNIIPLTTRSGQDGALINSFSPEFRSDPLFKKLNSQFETYEKQVNVSKGILSENEITQNATATEIRRSNADTISMLNKINQSIDMGNKETLKADAIYLGIPENTWEYSSDFYDVFEDAETQWARLLQGRDKGVVSKKILAKWLFPNMTDEAIDKMIEEIALEEQASIDSSINRMLASE